MKRLAPGLLIVGCLVAAALVLAVGAPAIMGALRRAGWTGVLAITGFHLIATTLMGLAWWLLQGTGRCSYYIWGRLLRDAGSEVLPLSQIGGYVLGARAPILHGIDGVSVAASVIVDATLEFSAQIAFILLGVVLLLRISHASPLAASAAVWIIPATAAAAILVVMQTRRPDLLRWVTERFAWSSLRRMASAGLAMHAEIGRIYGSKPRLLRSFLLHFGAWLLTGVEAWLALRFMGFHCDILVVLIVESMIFATRSMSFMVPGAVGVQEGAYLVLGTSLGLPPEMAIGLSLMKRARDFGLGVPVLVSWHFFERRRRR